MKNYDKKLFAIRYNRIVLITFLVILFISTALLTIQIISETEHDHEQLIEQFINSAIAIDDLELTVLDHLNLLQAKAEQYFFDSLNQTQQGILFQAITNNNDNDTIYSLDTIPFPFLKDYVGNITGAGRIKNLAPAVKDEIAMSLSLNSLFYASKQNIPNSAWIYYTSKNHFINIYPWSHSNDHCYTPDFYTHEFYQKGTPEQNPMKKAFWTRVYKDEYGLGMMVTAGKPVYRDSTFLGTVAIDLTLDRLVGYVKKYRETAGTMIITNNLNQVIAHPTATSSTDTVIKKFHEVLPPKLASEASRFLIVAELGITKIQSYICTSYTMKNAPWKIYLFRKEQPMVLKVLSKIGIVFIFFIVALAYMLIITNKMIFREFINPAEKMVHYISEESQNKASTVPAVPAPWKPWFLTISKIFTENRNLIQEIKEKNEMLTERNISMERYMPKFVLVLNVRRGCGSTTTGNFIAHQFAQTDRGDKQTMYIEYPNPADICKDFSLNPEQAVFEHPNGYDIWTSHNTGVVPQEARTSLLLNKILNKYNNIVMNAEIGDSIDSDMELILRHVKVIVLMIPPDDQKNAKVKMILQQLKKYVYLDKTNIYTLLNKTTAIYKETQFPRTFDFVIPFMKQFNPLGKNPYAIPEYPQSIIENLVDRAERVHQISVYIPTTVAVNKKIDARNYVSRTLSFLGERFGGATCSQADGIWNSDKAGLVNEVVHIVITHTTEDDLNQHMDEVIEFVRNIKNELTQEAMALEINQKLILI